MALSGVIAVGKDVQTALALPDKSLTAEIRKLKDGKLEFILKAGKEDISFYQEWNSWGWFARYFVAYDRNHPKTKYLIHR
jgi:hypothetical protein